MAEDVDADRFHPRRQVSRRRADALGRAEAAWSARVAGATWAEAAATAGYSCGENAARAVRQTYGTLPELDRSEQRSLWRARLEALWRQALRDALENHPGALTAAVRVAQAAARLDGLDAPTELVVHNPTAQELEAWVARMLSSTTPELEEADIFEDSE